MTPKSCTIVNIYNFIRMSHQEPSVFQQADFDTIARQIRLLKQYGLPATYALKYDALMDPHYRDLLRRETDENDEIAAWWEITEPLCRRAGVAFPRKDSDVFDERVDSAYSVGYDPDARRALVDAYMQDFAAVFGRYPQTIGSWVLDPVTLAYAQERYGVTGAAICRDQLGTDGFTLWGGWPNGVYFPSRQNEYLPAQTPAGQLPVAMFRLLGPDPVYSFEQDARPGLSGVYTLEPCCTNGRDPARIGWYFATLTDTDRCGVGYAQVGQENNFLWENIRPGFEPQLRQLAALAGAGKARVETMAESAAWFAAKYALTPPVSWPAQTDWPGRPAGQPGSEAPGALWYASRNYRLGLLAEDGRLRVRDWFLYDEAYPSRYRDAGLLRQRREAAAAGQTPPPAASVCDALPLLFAQSWMSDAKAAGRPINRPFVRLLQNGAEPQGAITFTAPDAWRACAALDAGATRYTWELTQDAVCIRQQGAPQPFALRFDCLPVLQSVQGRRVQLCHRGFAYGFTVAAGAAACPAPGTLQIAAENGEIRLELAAHGGLDAAALLTQSYRRAPAAVDGYAPRWQRNPRGSALAPLPEPVFTPPECVFPAGQPATVALACPQPDAQIRYTLDGTLPGPDAPLYTAPLTLQADAVLYAAASLPGGRASDPVRAEYRFGWQDVQLQSPTVFDTRPVFCGRGAAALLDPRRGSLDYQDGRWLATLQDLDITATLPQPRMLHTVELGFLSHHRSGIIFPQRLELYLGDDPDHLALACTLDLPEGPAAREIWRQDFGFRPGCTARCVRVVARRYARMPGWCCYKGVPDVFTLADCLILR